MSAQGFVVLVRVEYAEGVGQFQPRGLLYWFALNTPKALANFSPGFQPWDQVNTINTNAESVGKGCVTVRQRFQRWFCGLCLFTQGCSNPGLN
jgi:hypothetical protein